MFEMQGFRTELSFYAWNVLFEHWNSLRLKSGYNFFTEVNNKKWEKIKGTRQVKTEERQFSGLVEKWPTGNRYSFFISIIIYLPTVDIMKQRRCRTESINVS